MEQMSRRQSDRSDATIQSDLTISIDVSQQERPRARRWSNPMSA
jgi:hypothetical protein